MTRLLDESDTPGIHVLPDGHGVSRISDWIMYSVEAEYIDRVVAEYGPCQFLRSCQCRSSILIPDRIASLG